MKQFTKRDEGFVCENCGNEVSKLGYTSRDHCPQCLCSKHVDNLPGDRSETCHGILRPISVELSPKKGYVIVYKCDKCGAIRKNKAADDDDRDLIIQLTANQGNQGDGPFGRPRGRALKLNIHRRKLGYY